MKQILTIIFFLLFANAFSQNSNKIYTKDIDNFWVAYDSIQTTNDFSEKLNFINKLYIDKGTKGLKAFMKARDVNDSLYIKLIDELPKFWNSIRPNTLAVNSKTEELNKSIADLKNLYPELKDAEMYFTIGGIRSGGTTTDNMVLIGTEIATGNPKTDVSEFKNVWLKNVFADQSFDNIVSLNIHEYIHTQQNGNDQERVLSQCIKEGSCDFITELVIEKPLQRKYISYGELHFDKLKQRFKEEMFSNSLSNWLYNGGQKGESADLGYFIGYKICKSYYENSKNKSQAINDIINLNYNDEIAVEKFLAKSKFFKEKIDKEKLIKSYDKKRPYIVKLEPFENGAENVNPGLKEIRITFSKEMMPENYSINFSENGWNKFPITNVKGFENSGKTIILLVDLKQKKEYEFVITNKSFKSKDGFPLRENEYLIKFKTK